MEWTNEVIIEFLDLYEAEPAIWNPQNEHHKDRVVVYDAWKRIQAQLSVECSLNNLKRKKENLMSTFRKLSAKVKKSSTTGSGTCEVYKPEWFAYEKMASFLHTVYSARGTTTTERPKNDHAPFEDNTPPDNEDEPFNAAHNESESTILRNGSKDNDRDSGNSTVHKGGPPVGRKRKPENVVVIEQRMDEAYGFLKQVATKQKMKKSETQLFCDLLCTRLEVLDEHKRDIVMHEINNLMFHSKNFNCLPNAMPNQHFYQQPPNFTNFNHYQASAFGSSENSQSLLSPAPTPTPSTSSQVLQIVMERWRGRVAVVTGASAGIGAAIVEDLVDSGMIVVGIARREERLQDIKKTLEGKSGTFHPLKADVTKEESVKEAFKWIQDNLKGVDILVNNAGIFIKEESVEGNIDSWRKMYELNVFALGACSREAIKSMKERNVDDGHIININSVASHRIGLLPGCGPYSSSKHASKAITESLRRELAAEKSKIKVTSISPGLVRTEIFDVKDSKMKLDFSHHNCLEAKDISDAVHYVISTPPRCQINEIIIRPTGDGM